MKDAPAYKENLYIRGFRFFYVPPLLPLFFVFLKKSLSEQQQDMLLMDPE